MTYLEPTQAAGREFMIRAGSGEIIMLNLLRLREIADYLATPELAPDTPISGRAAYDLYIRHALPHLRASGGDMIFFGEGGPVLVGPEDERWDIVMLVRQASAHSFIAFAANDAYLAGTGHRAAAGGFAVGAAERTTARLEHPGGRPIGDGDGFGGGGRLAHLSTPERSYSTPRRTRRALTSSGQNGLICA